MLLNQQRKMRLALTALGVVLGLGIGMASETPASQYRKDVGPLLQKYCFDCHGDGMSKGEVAFDAHTNEAALFADQKLWIAAWDNLQSQLMPPAKKPQPSTEERRLISRWIERTVFKVDPDHPDPGRVTIRRLNREEYRNTILDLFGVEFDTTEAFPADDTGYGFDTIGDVLTMSPLLMEKYLDAANEIVEKLVNTGEPRIPTAVIAGDQFRGPTNNVNAEHLSFSEPAFVQHVHRLEHAGPYRLSVDLAVRGSEEATTHAARLVLKVNGKEIESRDLSWDNRKSIVISGETPLVKGTNRISLEIVPQKPPGEGENSLHADVNKVSVHGPLDRSFLEYPRNYRRVFLDGAPPRDEKSRRNYARKILRHFADRAFRRPIDEPSLERLTTLALDVAAQPNMNFEQGVGHALTAVLTSPRFLFRAELQPEPDNPGKVVRVDEFALASRLSYFLWSSLPDEKLFGLAREGKLRDNLRKEIDRMIEDPKHQRFIRNFVGQWLQTRDVEGINVDARRVLGIRRQEEAQRIFNPAIRRAMRQETEMLFDFILRENRSMDELLTADYTFLNQRLAEFYGIPDVKGQEMRKVSLPDGSPRGGILTHGTFLLVTSNPTRTSPVKRGLFVLDNILGTPAPPAPPNVPELEEARRQAEQRLTMREMMVIHREKPLCASCHARMDPIGLALENFNAIGQFRQTEAGQPIDTAGELITGEKFSNVRELALILTTSRRMDFYRCVAEKLLTFATGRGIEYYDSPTIEKLVSQLQQDGGKMRTLVYGIVESAPFQKRRGDGDRLLTDAAE